MTKQKNPGKKSVTIEFHADDYGLFPVQSRRILDCSIHGNLNGVSIMPNSSHLTECVAELYRCSGDIAVTVHLNLMEGKSLCPAEQIPMLTDGQGNLNCSFFALLLRSFLPGRRACKEQLKRELRAQIRRVRACAPENTPLRLDGHVHYHMIPVVFDAMMDVIREDGLQITYIRIPREYPSIYLRHIFRFQDFAPINLVKVLVLNLLSARAKWKYAGELGGLEQKLFLGVFLSGCMYDENVSLVLPDAVRLAEALGVDMEILAHPGGVYEAQDIEQITSPEDRAFLTSRMRSRESSLFRISQKNKR